MPVRPPKPMQVVSVPTVAPETVGYTVPQITIIPASEQKPGVPEAQNVSAWPKQKWVEWSWEEMFRRADAPTLSYRTFDAFVCAIAAAAAYQPLAAWKAQAEAFLPGGEIRRLTTAGPFLKTWDVYHKGGFDLLSFPGTSSARELFAFTGFTLQAIPNLPVNWWFWKGFKDTAVAYNDSFIAAMGPELARGRRSIIMTGHSLGGALCAWFSFYLNYISPFTEREKKPVIAAYSLASPASWVDVKRLEGFQRTARHFRILRTGDPVPSILQTATRTTPSEPELTERDLRVPQHYQSYIIPLGGNYNALSYGNSLAIAYLNLLNTPSAVLERMLSEHNYDEYLFGLWSQCKAKGDTPVGHFDRATDWMNSVLRQPFNIWD